MDARFNNENRQPGSLENGKKYGRARPTTNAQHVPVRDGRTRTGGRTYAERNDARKTEYENGGEIRFSRSKMREHYRRPKNLKFSRKKEPLFSRHFNVFRRVAFKH